MRALLIVTAAGLAALTPVAAAQSNDNASTVYVDGDTPELIAFLPAASERSAKAADVAARRHVAEAVDAVRRCLPERLVASKQVYADRIVVHARDGDDTFFVGSGPSALVGALLLRPDASPRIIYAGGGPEALVGMLPSAAGEYFEMPCADG